MGLRDNARSVGEYASERAGDESGRTLVKAFFKQLERYDYTLLAATRSGELSPDARQQLDGVIAALDE